VAGTVDPFAGFGPATKAKLVLLGSPDFSSEKLMDRARSLNLEHVSPTRLKGPEISRTTRASLPAGSRPVRTAADETATLALMRRWFFARKPDAGFVLTEFPATLLQAKVFDEWLEARGETLNGVIVGSGPGAEVVAHYRTLGLLLGAGEPPSGATATGGCTHP
jgi:adenylate kinase